jgi:hypothetical protein
MGTKEDLYGVQDVEPVLVADWSVEEEKKAKRK